MRELGNVVNLQNVVKYLELAKRLEIGNMLPERYMATHEDESGEKYMMIGSIPVDYPTFRQLKAGKEIYEKFKAIEHKCG